MANKKIVILDGHTLNPGDLSWSELEQHGEVTVYDRTPSEFTLERAKGADILFTNKTVLDESILSQLDSVEYIGILATGYNVVDINYAINKNIVVTNVPGYSAPSVAQAVFAFILGFANQTAIHNESVKNGDWCHAKDFCYLKKPLFELQDKTIGIVGFGSIGKQTALLAKAFGMKVLVHTRTVPKDCEGITFTSLDTLFSTADVVSLHCPLTEQTENIINSTNLEKMKSTALIINTSRGPLINEDDLAQALTKKTIAGAGIDVLCVEPPATDNPLLSAPNCIITPHIAWATLEARSRLLDIASDNLKQYMAGSPINKVI